MAVTYQLTSASSSADQQEVIRSDGAVIPPDRGNADFQIYLSWLAAGNTPTPVPTPTLTPLQQAQEQYAEAIAAGLTVSWSTSTSLNATYPIDETTQFNMTAEVVAISTNGAFGTGQATRNWPTANGSYVSLTTAQFKLLATACMAYLDNLVGAVQAVAAGGTPTWPANPATITG